MNARPLTDAQISQALRAHLPEAAAPGLRERVFEAAETTTQLRALPSFLGALSEADPITRRRSLLIAAALLVALALASAAAVGALRLVGAGPDRQIEPGAAGRPPGVRPLELRAAAPAAAGRPDLARQRLDQGPHLCRSVGRGPIRSVHVRRCDGALQLQDPQPQPPHQRDGERRVRGGLGRTRARGDRRGPAGVPPNGPQCPGEGPGCEMERDSSEVGNGTAAAGWRYVGLEYVAGRPTHHVACGGGDLWIDIETRLILRTQGPAVDDAGQPIPVESTEVTEIAFGEQPAALFEPPEGVARMSEDEYSAYICARDLPNELMPGISDCPTLRKRRLRRRPSPRPLRRPPCVQTRATARFRRETRASRSVHWPGPRRV